MCIFNFLAKVLWSLRNISKKSLGNVCHYPMIWISKYFFPIEEKMNEQNSDEISFHLYIDAVKDKKIPWNTFVKVMKDFYYQDLERLKNLNAMILMELTESYSDLEKSR